MIQSLKISNFQSHRDTELNFSPGVNTIIGASDCGKTAIKRALYWLIKNRPSGEAFRSTWGGATSVELFTDDDWNVGRAKDEKRNEYTLGNTNGRGGLKLYKAFGTGVPDGIIDVLNIDETNLQAQFDQPFLISNSPGEVASFFNRIAHLDQIDTSLKYIQSAIRYLDGSIKHDQVNLEEAEIALTEFDYLEKAEIDLEILEQMKQYWNQVGSSISVLSGVIQQYDNVTKELAETAPILTLESAVDGVLDLRKQCKVVYDQHIELSALIGRVEQVEEKIINYKDFIKLEPKVNALESLMSSKILIKGEYDSLLVLMATLKEVTDGIFNLQSTIGVAEDEFAFNMPDTCPLCNTILK